MYLYLLEFVYAVKDRKIIEAWIAQANLDGVLICTMQYDEEILAVLASEHQLADASQKICQQPAISSCEEKHGVVFQVTTRVAPELALRSFPFSEGEEWYRGNAQTAYLCLQSRQPSNEQISWLATCTQIVDWNHFYTLSPIPGGGKVAHPLNPRTLA